MYGYQNSEDLGPGKSGGKFGLNQNAQVIKFEYNPNAGSDGASGDAIDLTIQVGEREYRKRFFPVTKVFGDNGEITDTTSEEYKEVKEKEVALLNGTLTDIVKIFVEEEQIKEALSTPIANFKDFAEVLQRLVQGTPNWNKKPVDVFLSYQWKPSGDNDKTYLELPKNVKHGPFVVPAQPGTFNQTDDTSIKYVNAEGDIHPFKRSEWFAGSPFANQTIIGGSTSGGNTMGAATASATNW